MKNRKQVFVVSLIVVVFVVLISLAGILHVFTGRSAFITLVLYVLTILFILHALFTITWMLYVWNEEIEDRVPQFRNPKTTFSLLLPARHEEDVIRDTILAFDNIRYPKELFEVLVLVRTDDIKTIAKVEKTLAVLESKNIKLITFSSYPINKPHALNIGLSKASNAVVGVFDAEDEPHQDILSIVNTAVLEKHADVVQGGVSLMNITSRWFSTFNCLEYYFWFKSGLSFFTKFAQVTPLGGNTVFFNKNLVRSVGGWDESCLTEDADIGIRLSVRHAKLHIYYDEQHVTKEETPESLSSFIKQRTRWNQGFYQIFLKGDWGNLPTLKQKALILYVLLTPLFQSVLLFYLPLGVSVSLLGNQSIGISLFSFIPLALFSLQLIVNIGGLYLFGKAYRIKVPISLYIKSLFLFYPYQIILTFSALRGLYRLVSHNTSWEKTTHYNIHRQAVASLPSK